MRLARRELAAHPLQAALAVVGVALGVAVALAIQVANQSALRAMELSAEAAAGRATHTIVGGPAGLDAELFTRLRLEAGVRPSAPVVEESVALPDHPGTVLRLLGVDPFHEGAFRPFVGPPVGGGLDLVAFLAEPGAVLLARATAAELGLAVGDRFALQIGARRPEVRLIGLLDPADALGARLAADVLVADLATAQELLERPGRLDRIDLRLESAEHERRALAAIAPLLSGDTRIEPAGARAGALAAMTRGFRLNLSALGMLALVVGLFLVFNAASFSVVRRREELGTLRTLGATRTQVLGLVLGEATLVGLFGSVLGLLLGIGLARGLVERMTATINDLYFALEVRELALGPGLVAAALLLGLGATWAGALAPALEAAGESSRAAMRRSAAEDRARRGVRLAALAGIALLILGGVLLLLAPPTLPFAFSGLFTLILGAALVSPALAALLLGAIAPLAGRLGGAPAALAARGSVRSLSRTAVALAALVVALSTAVSVAVLIASFRTSVVDWLEAAFTADLYASTPALTRTRASAAFPAAAEAALAGAPQVERVLRYRSVELVADGDTVGAVALDLAVPGAEAFRFARGEPERALAELRTGRAVLVTEPLAHHRSLRPGDTMTFDTPGGPRAFEVAAVVRDYGSDRGTALFDLAVYRKVFDDPTITSLGLWLHPGHEPTAALAELRTRLPAGLEVHLSSNRDLREQTLIVFDRTFLVTGALRIATLLVALVGLFSALLALGLERRREAAVLRALGTTPAGLARLLLGQALLLGLAAGLLALPTGALLSVVMIDVVNQRSFGWSLSSFDLTPKLALTTLAWSAAVALLAALLPTYRATRTPPSLALRGE